MPAPREYPIDDYDRWLQMHEHKSPSTNPNPLENTMHTQYKIVTSVVLFGFGTSDVTEPDDLNVLVYEGWNIASHHVFCDGGRVVHTWTLSRTFHEPASSYVDTFANIARMAPIPNWHDDDDDDDEQPDDMPDAETDQAAQPDAETDEPLPAPLAAAVTLPADEFPALSPTQAAFDAAGEFVPCPHHITLLTVDHVAQQRQPISYREALDELAAGRLTWQQVAAIGDAEALAAAADAYHSRKLYVQE